MEDTLLYIIRNNGNSYDKNNQSILGVYTTPQLAKKAIEEQRKLFTENSWANFDVKVVMPNQTGYVGCSAFRVQELIDDPEGFEKKVREWYMWPTFKDEYSI